MRRGSITIFSLLSMLLVTATLLTLLEGCRVLEVNRLAKQQTLVAMEAVFANYHTALWEEYHLLATDQRNGEEIFIQYGNAHGSQEEGLNVLPFQVQDAEISSYTLLSDGEGGAYVEAVSNYMKDNLLYEMAQEIYSRYEAIKSLQDSGEVDNTVIQEALEELEKTPKEQAWKGKTSFSCTGEKETANPLKGIMAVLQKGLLELALGENPKLSQKELSLENAPSHRNLEEGKAPVVSETGWYEKLLLQQYVLTYMSHYNQKKESHYLAYEVEYLIGGQALEEDNLEAVISQIFLIREAANFLYLLSDSGKVLEAEGIAILVAGASVNPGLIELVKVAILTAWAFGESVLDVRSIMAGNKIPLMKSKDTWNLELSNLGDVVDQGAMAKGTKWGLSYEDYLGVLLLFQSESMLALRAMDVQELTMREIYGEKEFSMDALMVQAKGNINYSFYPLFQLLQEESTGQSFCYEIATQGEYRYERGVK